MANARVLVVCSIPGIADGARCALTAAGYDVRIERDGLAGLIAVEEWRPALVVLNWALPFLTGKIFLQALHAVLAAPPPVVALVPSDSTTALASGARMVVALVENLPALVAVVDTTLRNWPSGRR